MQLHSLPKVCHSWSARNASRQRHHAHHVEHGRLKLPLYTSEARKKTKQKHMECRGVHKMHFFSFWRWHFIFFLSFLSLLPTVWVFCSNNATCCHCGHLTNTNVMLSRLQTRLLLERERDRKREGEEGKDAWWNTDIRTNTEQKT